MTTEDPIIVSYSEVVKWQTCQRQYYYRYPLNLVSVEQSDAVHTGVMGHKFLQTFYELMKQGVAQETARELVMKQAELEHNKHDGFDSGLLKAWGLVDKYIAATKFVAEAFLVENRFLVPATKLMSWPENTGEEWAFWSNVQIGFTPDIVFERKGPRLDVEDSKFVQRAWSKSKVNRFQQAKLYQILLETMGYNVSRSSLRFFNVQTGALSVQHYTMGAAEKEILKRDFLAGVKEIVKYKLQDGLTQSFAPRTMNYGACQFCSYEFVCSLEAEGKDASKTMQTQFVNGDYDYKN